MTPEERANLIMANLSLVSVTQERWCRQYEMVEHQILEAIAAEREACAKVADEYVGCDQIAARIRSRSLTRGG